MLRIREIFCAYASRLLYRTFESTKNEGESFKFQLFRYCLDTDTNSQITILHLQLREINKPLNLKGTVFVKFHGEKLPSFCLVEHVSN